MKRFVIGDIHGRIEALKEVLNNSKFDYEKDKLIIIGDVVDGGYDTFQVIEELLKIKNKILCMGNHDEWFLDHIKSGWSGEIWLSQGGRNTLKSYGNKPIPKVHEEFFNQAVYYYEEDDMLFVHGGFNPLFGIEGTSKHDLVWDRELIKVAQTQSIEGYNKIFVGHTTTQMYGMTEPIKYNNLFMMDCGAGWNGKLVIMNIDTEEYWLSARQDPAR